MKSILGILILVVFLGFSYESRSEETFIGVNYGNLNTDTVDFSGITGMIGHNFTDFFGVQGRANFSSSNESYQGTTAEIENQWGVYLTASLPIEDSTNIYIIYGHTEGEIAFNLGGHSTTSKHVSSSLGFGMNYNMLEAYDLGFEYIELTDEITSFNVYAHLNF